jgi:hypothetical protein
VSRNKETSLRLLLDCMGSEMYLSGVFHPFNYPELEYQDLQNCEGLALACNLQCRTEYVYRLSCQDLLYGPRFEATLDFTVTRSTVGLATGNGTKKAVPCISIGDYSIHKISSRFYGITHTKTGLAFFRAFHDLNQTQCKKILITALTACNKRGIDPVNYRSHDDQMWLNHLMRSEAENLRK